MKQTLKIVCLMSGVLIAGTAVVAGPPDFREQDTIVSHSDQIIGGDQNMAIAPVAYYRQQVKCQIVNYRTGTVVGTVKATGGGNTIDKAKTAARKSAHKQLINGEEYMRHCTYSSARRSSGGGRF